MTTSPGCSFAFLARVWRPEGMAVDEDILSFEKVEMVGNLRLNLSLFLIPVCQQQTQPRFSANLLRQQACSPAMRPPFNNGRLIPCNHAGCGRFFQNRSGLTQHTRTSHKYFFSLPQPIRRVATPPLLFDLIDRSSSPPCVDENPEIDSFTDAESNADTTHDVDDDVHHDQPHEETRQPTVESHPFLTGLFVLCSPVPRRSCCTI